MGMGTAFPRSLGGGEAYFAGMEADLILRESHVDGIFCVENQLDPEYHNIRNT